MFRSLKLRRSLWTMSRTPIRLEAQQHRTGQLLNIQTVDVRKPRITLKGVIIGGVVTLVSLNVYTSIVFSPLVKLAKDLPPPTAKEIEEEEPIFLPFPLTTKEVEPIPYRGTDPEWTEYINFSKNPKLAQQVRKDLAAHVRQTAASHPIIRMQYGENPKLRRYWLDVDFPPVPPPTYTRSGIEIGVRDDKSYIEWVDHEVDSYNVYRLRHILWPTQVAQSTWALTKALAVEGARKLGAAVGIQIGQQPQTLEQLLARQQQQMQKQIPGKYGPSPLGPPPPAASDAPNLITSPPGTDKPALAEQEKEKGVTLPLFPIESYKSPILAFRRKWAQTMKPKKADPPRGCILVSGMVELDTPKAWLVFDVVAAYDPKSREFDHRTLSLKLRRLQPKKQIPARR